MATAQPQQLMEARTIRISVTTIARLHLSREPRHQCLLIIDYNLLFRQKMPREAARNASRHTPV